MIPLSPISSSSATSNRSNDPFRHYLFLSNKNDLTPDELTIIDNETIKCINPHRKQSSNKNINDNLYKFYKVFHDFSEFHSTSYNRIISPLIRQTINGDDTIALFAGSESLKIKDYLFSNYIMQGYLSQACSQLLQASYKQIKASITFSWYRIECNTSESITDILRTASEKKNTLNHHVISSSDQLIMREYGRGKGMIVPGLWEVEITTSSDIESVINHILKILPTADCSHPESSPSHTVMQLTYTIKDSQVTTQNNSNSYDNIHPSTSFVNVGTSFANVGTSAVSSSYLLPSNGPVTGRISFVVLSDLYIHGNNVSTTNTPSYPINGSSSSSIQTHSWVSQLQQVLEWIDKKHAAPPFHKSRLLLLLRDLICGRQIGTCLLMIDPSISSNELEKRVQTLSSCHQWLQLIQKMSTESAILANTQVSSGKYDNSRSNTHDSNKSHKNKSLDENNSSYSVKDVLKSTDRKATLSLINSSSKSMKSHENHVENVNSHRKHHEHDKMKIHGKVSSHYHVDSNDYLENEEILQLKERLEKLESENKQLKSALNISNANAQEYENAYNSLIEQLKQEVG